MSNKNMKEIVACVERGESDSNFKHGIQIGAAFENADGSWNNRFDFYRVNPNTTIQTRVLQSMARTREQGLGR